MHQFYLLRADLFFWNVLYFLFRPYPSACQWPISNILSMPPLHTAFWLLKLTWRWMKEKTWSLQFFCVCLTFGQGELSYGQERRLPLKSVKSNWTEKQQWLLAAITWHSIWSKNLVICTAAISPRLTWRSPSWITVAVIAFWRCQEPETVSILSQRGKEGKGKKEGVRRSGKRYRLTGSESLMKPSGEPQDCLRWDSSVVTCSTTHPRGLFGDVAAPKLPILLL